MTDATPEDSQYYSQMDEEELSQFITGAVLYSIHEAFYAGASAALELARLVDAGLIPGDNAEFNGHYFNLKREEVRIALVDKLFPVDNEEGPKEGEVQGSAGSDAAEGAVDTETD